MKVSCVDLTVLFCLCACILPYFQTALVHGQECGDNPMKDVLTVAKRTGRTLTHVLTLLRDIDGPAYDMLSKKFRTYASCIGLIDTGYFRKRSGGDQQIEVPPYWYQPLQRGTRGYPDEYYGKLSRVIATLGSERQNHRGASSESRVPGHHTSSSSGLFGRPSGSNRPNPKLVAPSGANVFWPTILRVNKKDNELVQTEEFNR